MTDPIFRRLLGVPDASDPRRLLGLTDGALTRVQIEIALRERLDQVYRHPDGRAPAADQVRQALRDAARTLISS
ncbi:MAG: hypothetical protein HKN62_19085, partial [Phycisphaerales bacterium]|nr:hypothetical protein [Phycisphaerales bacterium]